MNLAALTLVIEGRLASDNGAGGIVGLLTGGYSNAQASPAPSYPYMVYNVTAASEMDAFGADVVEVTVDFHIYDSTQNGLTTITSVLDRLFGDKGAATYGFHRWKPTLSGGWTPDCFRRVGQFSQSDTVDAYHYIDTYQIIISR